MEMLVLGSGSGGNAIVVRHQQSVLLIDAGLSAKQLLQRLELVGISACDLSAILLTHEHGDHTRGLQVFCKKHPIPVYANLFTKEALSESISTVKQWNVIQTGLKFHIDAFEIECFPVPHDAADPVGFAITNTLHGTKVGVLNDIGHVTHLVRDRLQGVSALYVEANYDEHLLEIDTKRPWATKQRISSRHGHLSNHQASELVEWLAPQGLKHVILGHLSRDCNQPDLAIQSVKAAFQRCNLEPGEVWCASQESPTEWLSLTSGLIPDGVDTVHSPTLSETAPAWGKSQDLSVDYDEVLNPIARETAVILEANHSPSSSSASASINRQTREKNPSDDLQLPLW